MHETSINPPPTTLAVATSTSTAQRWLLLVPALALLFHLTHLSGYGWFRDELYYLACSERLDWGYVDHPAFSIVVLRIWTTLFGDSVEAIRVVPALAGTATIWVVGQIARRLGGGWVAQLVAMGLALAAPGLRGSAHLYSMNVIDQLVWALVAWQLARLLVRADQLRLIDWAALGGLLAIGLANKISVLWLGAGLAVALVLSPLRRELLRLGPWLAGSIALVAGLLPYLLWQLAHNWPTREFVRNATEEKMELVTTAEFLLRQGDNVAPLAWPLLLAGLAWLTVSGGGRWRALAAVPVVVAVILLSAGTSRPGYLLPAYAAVFAAAGMVVEQLADRLGRWPRAGRYAAPGLVGGVLAVIALQSAITLPFAVPVLSVERFIAYQAALGVAPDTAERKEIGSLPQHYADSHGWEDIVATFVAAYRSLPPAEQVRAAIYAGNYGVAGAIDRLGGPQGLPGAISGHNNYYLWGPGDASGEVLIVHGSSRERLSQLFEQVDQFGHISCGHCMPYENGQPVWICRRAKRPLGEIWPETKNFS